MRACYKIWKKLCLLGFARHLFNAYQCSQYVATLPQRIFTYFASSVCIYLILNQPECYEEMVSLTLHDFSINLNNTYLPLNFCTLDAMGRLLHMAEC